MKSRFSRACSTSEKMPFSTRYSSVLDEEISAGIRMASSPRERGKGAAAVASTLCETTQLSRSLTENQLDYLRYYFRGRDILDVEHRVVVQHLDHVQYLAPLAARNRIRSLVKRRSRDAGDHGGRSSERRGDIVNGL